MNKENEQRNILTLPALAMRGLLVFPKMTLSIDVERSSSVQAADLAASGDHLIFMAMQKNLEDEDPKPDDIHTIGILFPGCFKEGKLHTARTTPCSPEIDQYQVMVSE